LEEELKYKDQTVVFFDDECLICNGFVRKIIKFKSKKTIYFAPLSRLIISDENVKIPNNTIILYNSGNFYFKSSAVLRILFFTKLPTKMLGCFLITPLFLRDLIYDKIARKRYLISEKTFCDIPDKSISELIINHNIVI
jgi:predicted DCC family thiol-disulfide oxidoreductase YuxK